MSPATLKSAACETCTWHASGATAFTQADAHEAATGHVVRRSGTGDSGDRPAPYTQPHEGDQA